MKWFVFFIVMLIILLPQPLLFSATKSVNGYANVNVSEAKQTIETNPNLVILDVRTQTEYDEGHIQNAVLIPVSELESRLDELDKGRDILVYCTSGIRSATASQILVDNGFCMLCVHNMLGGITAWTDAGYPVYVRYSPIQEAIDDAIEGDTIYVSSGTYYENVIVNKTVSLVGENRDTTIIDGNGTGVVLKITQNNVNVTGLTIRGSGSTPNIDAGIYLENVGHCTISGNRLLDNEYGVSLRGSCHNTISENLAMESYFFGFHLEYSSNHNTLVKNFMDENRGGVNIHFSSHFNTVSQNRIANGTYGVSLNNADSNQISQNYMSHLELGICFQIDTDYNMVIENNITDCSDGIELRQASNNRFHHNTFNNPHQVVISNYGYVNFWDDGYPSGGNYWSDYVGVDLYSGSHQNITGSDGIGDAPYIIDENNIDHYPLMNPWILVVLKTDLNNDGTVNILDISIVAIAFGSKEGDEHYNVLADLDENNEVNILDVSIVAMDYGKTV